MNYIDIIIAILLLISIVSGWRQGFVRQLFGLLALLAGVYCAYKFSHFAAHYITSWFGPDEAWTNGIAFAVTFVVVLIGVVVIGRIADRFVKLIALGLLNSLLGAVLSLLKMALILSVCLLLLNMFEVLPDNVTRESYLYQPLDSIGARVFPYLQKLLDLFTAHG